MLFKDQDDQEDQEVSCLIHCKKSFIPMVEYKRQGNVRN